jgi:ABC-type branched-subunit amino acid transport system permease subunit
VTEDARGAYNKNTDGEDADEDADEEHPEDEHADEDADENPETGPTTAGPDAAEAAVGAGTGGAVGASHAAAAPMSASPTPRAARTPPTQRTPRRERAITAGAVALVLLLLGFLTYDPGRAAAQGLIAGVAWETLLQFSLVALLFALFALGLHMEYGRTGLPNFGHAAFLGVGAYAGAILTAHFGWWMDDGPVFAVLGVVAVVAAAVTAALVLAVLVGLPTVRLRPEALAILTIGAAQILHIAWLDGRAVTNGADGLATIMPGGDLLRDGAWAHVLLSVNEATGILLDPYRTVLLIAAIVVFAAATWYLRRLAASPWGRISAAIRENEPVAAALGKNVRLVKMQSLAIGSVIAALAGVLYSWSVGHITPLTFVPVIAFYAWVIVLVGAGNPRGLIAGSVLLWGLFESARHIDFLADAGVTDTAGPLQVFVIGVAIVFVTLFRPRGILGEAPHG